MAKIDIFNMMMFDTPLWKPWYEAVYIDCSQYLADPIFEKNGVTPWVVKELSHDGGKFLAIIVRVKKKKMGAFLDSLHELQKNMIICGYPDYEKFCRELSSEIMSSMALEGKLRD